MSAQSIHKQAFPGDTPPDEAIETAIEAAKAQCANDGYEATGISAEVTTQLVVKVVVNRRPIE